MVVCSSSSVSFLCPIILLSSLLAIPTNLSQTSRPVFKSHPPAIENLKIFRHFLKIFAIDRRHFATPSSGRFSNKF
jgi:hypothetical protein